MGLRSHILWVDDDADMRQYVQRLLGGRYDVETVADGQAALEASRSRRPDLVLTKMMMPRLDGFELVRALRHEPATRSLPIILLLSRVGEEGPVEGLENEVDDYLIKPFSAQELTARIGLHLELARMRAEMTRRERTKREAEVAQARLREILNSSSDGVFVLDQEWRYKYVNPRAAALMERSPEELLGQSVMEQFPHIVGGPVYQKLHQALAEQKPIHFEFYDHLYQKWFENNFYPSPSGMTVLFRDVTERKRTEEALRSSEERFRNYFDLGLIGMAITSSTKRFIDVNHKICEILGYEREELLKMNWTELTHPEELDAEISLFNAVLTWERDGYSIDKRFIRKDGRIIHATTSVKCRRRSDGSVDHFVALLQEITERKRMEEALRTSEERFRRSFNLGLVGMVITSPTKGFIDVNDKVCEVLGYDRRELAQMTWAELTHPDDLISDVAHFNRVLAGESDGYSIEKRFIRKDGQTIYAVISVKCLRREDGSVDSCVALLQDITEKKQVEKKVAFQADLLNVVEQAVIATDLDGAVTFWNRFAEKLYGWRADEAIGRNILEVVPTQFLHEQAGDVTDLLKGSQSWSGELLVRHREGWTFPAMAIITPIFDQAVVGTISVFSDITEKIKAEEALKQKMTAAEALSSLKSKFVSTASHELRIPLNAIVGFSTLLKDPKVFEDPSKRAAMVDTIHRNAKNLVDLINSILDFSKIDSEQTIIQNKVVSLPEIAKEIVNDLRLLAETKGLTLKLVENPNIPSIQSDAGKLRQIFANLISNAIKFTETGSITVRMHHRAEQRKILIEIEDTGIGMAEDQLPHIFEPFYQIEQLGKRSLAGTGLGLAIVKEFTHLLGASIEVVSRLQEGSRFTITLPYAERRD
jgi:PAS domain S-box-containing protein